MPEATIPTLFIPLFFLAVNIGQISKTFPCTTPFLHGQGYVGFQLPVSLMFAVCTATSGLALVTEIDLGYFDKLLVAPIRRSSIIFGRLAADLVRGTGGLHARAARRAGVRRADRAASPARRARPAGGAVGAWPTPGIGMLVALHTRNVQATNASFLVFFPLLFLTPNFVPFDLLTAADGGARASQPGQLRDRRPALARARRLGARQARDLLGVIFLTGLILTWLSVRAIDGLRPLRFSVGRRREFAGKLVLHALGG